MVMHRLYRNGRLFDEMDPNMFLTTQIARSFAKDMPGDTFTLKDELGNVIYEITVAIHHPERKADA